MKVYFAKGYAPQFGSKEDRIAYNRIEAAVEVFRSKLRQHEGDEEVNDPNHADIIVMLPSDEDLAAQRLFLQLPSSQLLMRAMMRLGKD